LVAAVGSYLDALQHRGSWHLRIDDLDPPREQPGAAGAILRCLEAHGLFWAGPVVYQSQRSEAYEHALEQLRSRGLLFACRCSRRQLEGHAIYPGNCRCARLKEAEGHALRLRSGSTGTLHVTDRLTGTVHLQIDTDIGDFVVRRKDGLYAYHLAVVIDDAALGISDVVRGRDLLDTTGAQVLLQQRLQLPTPRYLHLPLATHADGQKLSKQNHAPALDNRNAVTNLRQALAVLKQATPPPDIDTAESLLRFAALHWQPQA
jgi:glutamyl-Q tRNA(Asp) synthetase